MYKNHIRKNLVLLTRVLFFNGFGWNIIIHGNKALTLTGKNLEV